MKRKVIQIGGSTQLISLPRKWVIEHAINKGDELEIEQKGPSLIVRTEKDNVVKMCTVNLRDMDTLRRRSLTAAYLKGYDEVEVLYNSPEYIEVIQNHIGEFPGYDIVQQGKNSCVIKQISKPTAKEFDSIFNRLFLLLHDMGISMAEAVSKKDKEMLRSIQFREKNINRFANFCRRILNKNGHMESEKISSLYFILTQLEYLGDEFKELTVEFLEKNPSKAVQDVLSSINELFESGYRLFHNYSKQQAIKNAKKRDTIVEKIETIVKKEQQLVMYYHLKRTAQIIIQMQESMLLLNT